MLMLKAFQPFLHKLGCKDLCAVRNVQGWKTGWNESFAVVATSSINPMSMVWFWRSLLFFQQYHQVGFSHIIVTDERLGAGEEDENHNRFLQSTYTS